ncbi:MAG TPA: cyclic peptide export ABC transporter [Chitinophaga sp.]|uniref:cyclic peptide export ABC transporter n=1 Tax=Chitinophaga sp. TaxID=1869181 RepID=UPI002F9230E1
MKRILKLVLPMTGKWGFLKYVCLGILSGLCSFLFIKTVTGIMGLIIAGDFTVNKEYILVFLSIILAFVWIRKTLSLAIIRLSQTLFWDLRKQILKLVLNTNYQQLSGRRADVHSAIVSDVNILTTASMSIIDFCTASVLAISCLVYLASISMLLFGLTLGVASIGVSIYHFRSKADTENFRRARGLENRFQAGLNSILDGFKEIYMEPRKGAYIFNTRINTVAKEAYTNNTNAYAGFLTNQITGQVLFYVLISSILVFFSVALKINTKDTVSFVFTLLYLLGSIETIMVLLPSLARARVASTHLFDLKARLEAASQPPALRESTIFNDEFEQITVHNLEYYYGEHDKAFGIGPVNFEIQKGDTIFIYGGNGSGKTTFVHTVLGLRIPSAGGIRYNNILVDEDNYPDYRTAFAVVFSDFYLFNELVGLENVNMEKWEYYLQLFEIEDKVTMEKGMFSTTDLSTGQRKRLALIAALLEEKPILVMDEWAADQDPYFRRKFYTEIIPLLKKEGFTIIAITHDDKYYHCADKLYKMDYGKLIAESVSVYQ